MASDAFTRLLFRRSTAAFAAVLVCIGMVGGAYAWHFSDRIAPGVWAADIPLGGLTQDEAGLRITDALESFTASGIPLSVSGRTDALYPEEIAFTFDTQRAVDDAYRIGHEGTHLRQVWERFSGLWHRRTIPSPVSFDEAMLRNEIATVAQANDIPRHDVRLVINGTVVSVLTDTAPGLVIDREAAFTAFADALRSLRTATVALELHEDPPRVTNASSQEAVAQAERIIARPLYLDSDSGRLVIGRDILGSWVRTAYGEDTMSADIDRVAIATYVTSIAKRLDVDPIPPQVSTSGGRVVGFTPPRVGRAVEQDALVEDIAALLRGRGEGKTSGDVLTVPMRTTRMSLVGLDGTSGITELIGKATTPFTGSPPNRIANIKNGVKFLTGTVVQPGEEFSTLKTLGTIDNTTGYLPELVIKGDRTIPEYGGGLCQVSTTLFRTALDAGLPITARRNHSFRVGYYEKDANGRFIGPGLDATIYEPDVDFRFRNDTGNPVLIVGYVVGDKISFEFYGTKDGRTGTVTGPTVLTETPAGEPVYIETTDLAPGVKKQVEYPHPGGSTTASYTIRYADGRTETQEFKSWYRRWPAVYLVGVATLSTPMPVSPPLPSETP